MGESEYNVETIIDDFMHCKKFDSCGNCNAFKRLTGFNNTKISSCTLLSHYLVKITNKIDNLLENEL